MLPKSLPKLTISNLVILRARFTAGRPFQNATISSNPCKFSLTPNRVVCGALQNMPVSVSTSFLRSAPNSAITSGSYTRIAQNNFLAGSTVFGIDALTVYIGSFTTWLNRKCSATLHSRYACT